MGCDIHFFVEKFSTDPLPEGPKDIQQVREDSINDIIDENEIIESRWISADTWRIEKGYEGEEDEWYVENFYSGRNYFLFSVLADVRSGFNTTYEYYTPKGVPDNVSYPYSYMSDYYWKGDAHSHSYFTLKELLDIKWESFESEEIEWLSDFMETIEKMKEIDTDPEKVRCLFFFDN